MIYIDNIRGMKPREFDMTFAIVRYMRTPSQWIRQLDTLAPSASLFGTVQELRLAGNWNAETFKSIYVPRFLWEMSSPFAKDALQDLVEQDKRGARIQLCCFCQDPAMCHRSIVAGLLQGLGADVHTPEGVDYSHYMRRL